jgi:hypothetical protein
VAQLEDGFHSALVSAVGNSEMATVHIALAEKIRIMRRFDFTQDGRNEATYQEYDKILRLLLRQKFAEASVLLCTTSEKNDAVWKYYLYGCWPSDSDDSPDRVRRDIPHAKPESGSKRGPL